MICHDHIRAGDNPDYWRGLLNQLRNQNQLKFRDQMKRAKDVPIESLMARYGLEINRAGFVHCPIHEGDSGASLKIYTNSNTWHCYGCGAGSSTIDFVMYMQKVGFKEAIKILI